MSTAGLMNGKRGLVMGVANDRSIAWGIAKALHQAGAELAFTYLGETFRKRVLPLVEPLNPAAGDGTFRNPWRNRATAFAATPT